MSDLNHSKSALVSWNSNFCTKITCLLIKKYFYLFRTLVIQSFRFVGLADFEDDIEIDEEV